MILTKEDIEKIPIEERHELLNALWESLPDKENTELTDEQKKMLDERIAEAEKNPDSFVPWKEVRNKLI